MKNDDGGGPPLLAILSRLADRVLGPGECQISLSQIDPSRAELLDLRAPAPVLVLMRSAVLLS